MNNNTNNNNNRQGQSSSWLPAGAWGFAAAAVVGGAAAYLLSGSSKEKEEEQRNTTKPSPQTSQTRREPERPNNSDSNVVFVSRLSNMMERALLDNRYNDTSNAVWTQSSDPNNVAISNLNSLLNDIYVRFLKLQEFIPYYTVFDTIFYDLHNKMKEVDVYYRKYSSTVQFSGSHYDKLCIKKPDEFDMNIVIRLPLNNRANTMNSNDSDIILEPKSAGFIQLKMGKQFKQLPMRDKEEWLNNKAAFTWMDKSNYLLSSEFIYWFESVVNRALDKYKERYGNRPLVHVEGKPYTIEVSKSGPAMTLLIRDLARNFKMDVNIVPALKFPEDRWPICKSYRSIPSKCRKEYFMVVPKPNKDSSIPQDWMRSWLIDLHNQERELMYNSHNLKQTVKLMKALRDARNMHHLINYYINTLFFWEIEEINNESYWRNSPAVLFTRMVGKFHEALVKGNIPYYWNKNNNLIANVPSNILAQYAKELKSLMAILDDPAKYKLVVKYLLSDKEFKEYNSQLLHI